MVESIEPQSPEQKSDFSGRVNLRTFTLILVLLFAGLLVMMGLVSEAETFWNRVIGVGMLVFLAGLALFDNLYETGQKEQYWRQLADRTGLTCRVNGFILFGYSVEVSGNYRDYPVVLYSFKQGKSQVPSTRLELQLKNETNDTLRLRGPFRRNEAQTDKVVNEMFEATEARQFGDDIRFFIRSRPIHLVTTIFRNGSVIRDKLQMINTLVNIELRGHRLFLDQIGILADVDYLYHLLDLLCDLADEVEQQSYGKLLSSAKKMV